MSNAAQIVIIGTGFSGLGMGNKLNEAGADQFVIPEQGADNSGN